MLVLASIVLLPDAFVRWFLPKDALAAVAVAVASVAVARGRLPRWFAVAAGAVALLTLLSVLLSAAPAAQLWGRWPRYEGLITLPVYFGAVWAGVRLLGPDAADSKLRTLTRAVATAAIALGVVSLLEAAGAGPFPSDLARPGSLTGNATDQGILGALFLAVLALPVLRAWTGLAATDRAGAGRGGGSSAGGNRDTGSAERVWLTAGLLLAVTSVILSASRAGLLAAGVVLVVLLVLELVRLGRGFARRTALGGIAALLLLLGGALTVPFTRDRLLGSSPLSASSLEARFTFWRDSLTVLGSHPFGVGASGFLNANASASTGVGTLDSPHNWLLQISMAGGIPLLVLVLGIVVATATGGVRAWRRLVRGAPDSESGSNARPSAPARVDVVGTGRASAAHAAAVLARADAVRADLLAAALAGLSGFGVALLTHFTAPSTTVLAAALVGALMAQSGAQPRVQPGAGPGRVGGMFHVWLGSGAGRSASRGIRTVVLAGWAIWLVVLMGAEVPLASGVDAAAGGDVAAAEEAFESAQSLRPWDADLASIAAQSFAAAAAAEVPGAAPHAVAWAERSRAVLPGTVATERALAVGQLSGGDAAAAARTLDALTVLAPRDVAVAVQHAVALYLAGDISGCDIAVRRALTLDPTEPTALRLRGIIFAE